MKNFLIIYRDENGQVFHTMILAESFREALDRFDTRPMIQQITCLS